MDQPQTIESGKGMLKDDYDSGNTAISEALRRKRLALADGKRVVEPSKEQGEENA